MIATRWQAWVALGAVVAGMIALLVLGDGEAASDPRRSWRYDAPKATLMDQIVRDVMSGPTVYRVKPAAGADGWQDHPPRYVAVPEDEPDPPPPPPEPDVEARSLVVQVSADTVVINDVEILPEQANQVFEAAFDRDHATQVVFQVDADVGHGKVVDLMERAKAAGLTRLAIGIKP